MQLGTGPSYFCSQECFKSSWAIHKLIHAAPAPASTALASHFAGFQFTGSYSCIGLSYALFWIGKLRPATVSPRRSVPDHIEKPDYAETGEPLSERAARKSIVIDVKTPEEIEAMRVVCRVQIATERPLKCCTDGKRGAGYCWKGCQSRSDYR